MLGEPYLIKKLPLSLNLGASNRAATTEDCH